MGNQIGCGVLFEEVATTIELTSLTLGATPSSEMMK